MLSLALLAILAGGFPQAAPSGGEIAKLVPPVPTPASFVSDQRNVLKPDARAALDARIRAVQAAGHGDIAVAILPSVGDYSPNQVGVEIYRTWRVGRVDSIGSARRNLGALLLVVPKEISPNNRGECWITTGTGAEAYITDATAAAICRDAIIPHLRKLDHAAGIAAGIDAIAARLGADPALAPPATVGDDASRAAAAERRGDRKARRLAIVGSVVASIGALFAGVLGFLRWRRNKPRKCAKCGRLMQRLDERADDAKLDSGQRLEEEIRSVDYDVWGCRCGESLVVPYRKIFSMHTDCRECHRRTATHSYQQLVPATTASAGVAEKRFTCKNCKARWTETVVIPRITQSHSSGGRGGGGGSSFGGSGSTSGGGGGGSY
ncbi:MAG: TPM domain-containing protein [Gemmatimonadota bacterium]|nr:TPM domain-containing protein [Gemmatimonadota bacterium]